MLKRVFVSSLLVPYVASTTVGVEEDCYPFAVALNFFNAQLTANNLGGQGPIDSELQVIRYANVGVYDGESFDMVAEVVSGSDYVPANSHRNGLNGKFGQINLLLDQKVDLRFSFRHQTTDELITLPYFYFSFFDLDQGANNIESICMDNNQFQSMHIMDNNLEMNLQTSTTSCSGLSEGTGSTTLSSNPESRGYLCDNPFDPTALGIVTCEECEESCTPGGKNSEHFPIDQRNRSVSFTFRDTGSFQFTFEADHVSSGNPNSGRNLLFAGRSSLSPCPDPSPTPTAAPVAPPVAPPTKTPGTGTNGGGSHTCFSAQDRVQLESGKRVAFRDLEVGDRILSANRDGVLSYSNVIFLPHGENSKRANFLEIKTEGGKTVKMTHSHLVPVCGESSSTLVRAIQLKPGESCLRTADGDDKVVSVTKKVMNGVYSAVTQNEFLVVNGIIASPFASSPGSSGALVHAYFNLTDAKDWCASNNWLAFENAKDDHVKQMMSAESADLMQQPPKKEIDGNTHQPSDACLAMLKGMFENYKDEPIGWGVEGFGYRNNWLNPSTPQVLKSLKKVKTAPFHLSGWD